MATDTLLDLDGVSVRTEGVVFELLDNANQPIGDIHPAQGASITNNTSQGIKRQLSGFQLDVTESVAVDPLSDRVRPYWVLGDGSRHPLGVFLFGAQNNRRRPWGIELNGTLTDQNIILSQQVRQTVSFPQAMPATDAMRQVADLFGFFDVHIDASTSVLGSPWVYPAGKSAATGLKILSDLCQHAGFHSPYFDNHGRLTLRALFDPATVSVTLKYMAGGRIASDSPTEQNDLLDAPNLYIVVDTAAAANPMTVEYPIPDSAPHSYGRRKFWIPKYIEAPGIANVDQATELARTQAITDIAAWQTVKFLSPADPRHDTFDPVYYLDESEPYLELGWTLPLQTGAFMQHEIKRVYL